MAINIVLLGRGARATGHYLPAICWGYFVLHAAVTAYLPHWSPDGVTPDLAVRIQRNASQTMFMLLIYLPALWTLPNKIHRYFMFGLGCLLVFDFVWMNQFGWGVLFTWPSFETAMAALVLPFLYHERDRHHNVIAVILWAYIAYYHGTTGLLCGIFGLVAYLLCIRQWWVAIIPGLTLPLVLWMHGPGPRTSGRIEAWTTYMDWWEHFANPVWGLGTGAAEWVIPFISWKPDATALAQTMNLMHNDWLQIVFDTGLVGLLSSLIIYTWALYRLWPKPQYFATAVAFGVAMLSYFPLHYAVGQVIACFLLTEAVWGFKVRGLKR